MRYSIVIPVYDEEAVIPLLLHRIEGLLARLDGPAEVIFVDDGSRDTGPIVLRAKAFSDPRFRFIGLSRNFGHQTAITAGIDAAAGDAVIVMDADLQDPPELVLEMIARWRDGYQVVDAKRRQRAGEGRWKLGSASLFYRLLNRVSRIRIPEDVGDFRLIDRAVADAFRAMPERDRFVRGMFAWLGFRHATVEYDRAARGAGVTKYPLARMLRLATDGIIGFSDLPLRAAVWGGLCVSGLAFLYACYVGVAWMAGSRLVEGWASTVIVLSFLSGMHMMMTGMVGLYVGRIHAEVKRRPLYVVESRVGFPDGAAARPAARAA
ncbi:glycosyltransferase family 2 protein [Methylobacterium sp. A54F]